MIAVCEVCAKYQRYQNTACIFCVQLANLKILDENRLQDWNCVGVFGHMVIKSEAAKIENPFLGSEHQSLGYPCIVFELLGEDLRSYRIKRQSDGDAGVSLNIIRQILLQV